MAKKRDESKGKSKIRFVMLEAEIEDDNFSQLTEAITNALRPQQTTVIRQTISSGSKNALPVGGIEQDDSDTEAEGIGEVIENEQNSVKKSSKPTAKRSFRSPNVISGIDFKADKSFVDFANEKNPSSTAEKYLVAAAWFKQHRDIDAISMDHVYTCFRLMSWSTSAIDFSQPLRDLKKEELHEQRRNRRIQN